MKIGTISSYLIIPGIFYYSSNKRRSAVAAANKVNPADGNSKLRQAWEIIKAADEREEDVVLDSVDLCNIINHLVSFDVVDSGEKQGKVPESNKEYAPFFDFIRRRRQAASFISSLLTGEPSKGLKLISCNIEKTAEEKEPKDPLLSPETAAIKKLNSIIGTGDYLGTFWLFSHLFQAGEKSASLLELAAKSPGGIAALMRCEPEGIKQLAKIPFDELLSLAGKQEDNLFRADWQRNDFAQRLFLYLVKHRKGDFKGHAISNLFPVRDLVDEAPSPDRRSFTPPHSSALQSAQPSPERSDRLASPGLGTITEVAEGGAGSDLLSSPGLGNATPAKSSTTGDRSKLSSPHLGAQLDFSGEMQQQVLVPPPTPTVHVSVAKTAVKVEQIQTMTWFKEYLLQGKQNDSLALLFHEHPEIFYNFALHATDEELRKLLSVFLKPVDFLERTRKIGAATISHRIFEIAAFLAERTVSGDADGQERLTNFFAANKEEFGSVLRCSLNDILKDYWSEHSGKYKAPVLAMVNNPTIREQLRLADKPHLLNRFMEIIDTDTPPQTPTPPTSEAQRRPTPSVNASYVLHYHLVMNSEIWHAMKKENWEFFRMSIPGAKALSSSSAKAIPQESVNPKPPHNLYLARFKLEEYGLIKVISDALASDGKKLDNETAYLIAHTPKYAKAFRELGPNAWFWAKWRKSPESLWTAADLRALNPILQNVWDKKPVAIPAWTPPRRTSIEEMLNRVHRLDSEEWRAVGQGQSQRITRSPTGLEPSVLLGNGLRLGDVVRRGSETVSSSRRASVASHSNGTLSGAVSVVGDDELTEHVQTEHEQTNREQVAQLGDAVQISIAHEPRGITSPGSDSSRLASPQL